MRTRKGSLREKYFSSNYLCFFVGEGSDRPVLFKEKTGRQRGKLWVSLYEERSDKFESGGL